MSEKYAIFAGGCFWSIQAIFDSVNGVTSTTAGYTGGTLKNPSYKEVCSGATNHAEAVLIKYNESIISYDELLDIFFSAHNPTQLNRQGQDVGTQYRSIIFVIDSYQEAKALNKIRKLNESRKYSSPIVTEVLPEMCFYPAEEYHQNYLKKLGKNICPNNNTSL